MSGQSNKRQQHDGVPQSTKVTWWALPAAGVAIFIAGSLVVWLRSRQTEPTIDGHTVLRLSQRSGSADHPAAFASDIAIGEPADSHPSS